MFLNWLLKTYMPPRFQITFQSRGGAVENFTETSARLEFDEQRLQTMHGSDIYIFCGLIGSTLTELLVFMTKRRMFTVLGSMIQSAAKIIDSAVDTRSAPRPEFRDIVPRPHRRFDREDREQFREATAPSL